VTRSDCSFYRLQLWSLGNSFVGILCDNHVKCEAIAVVTRDLMQLSKTFLIDKTLQLKADRDTGSTIPRYSIDWRGKNKVSALGQKGRYIRWPRRHPLHDDSSSLGARRRLRQVATNTTHPRR